MYRQLKSHYYTMDIVYFNPPSIKFNNDGVIKNNNKNKNNFWVTMNNDAQLNMNPTMVLTIICIISSSSWDRDTTNNKSRQARDNIQVFFYLVRHKIMRFLQGIDNACMKNSYLCKQDKMLIVPGCSNCSLFKVMVLSAIEYENKTV